MITNEQIFNLEAWHTLALAILFPYELTADGAMENLAVGSSVIKHRRDVSTAELIEMRKTMTYKEIGEAVGMKKDAVFNRIKRYKGLVK